MSRKFHHIVPDPKGGWNVKRSGTEKGTLHTDKKQDAIEKGREVSRNQGTEFYIHRKDGKIQQKDSHGNDPRNIKG